MPASSGETPALRPPEHQVAGHRAGQNASVAGPLIDGAGLFYKPLQSSGRGDAELAFYNRFSTHPSVPESVRCRFFPAFHGAALVGDPPAPHLVLEDLVARMKEPSVIDVKIGAITWPPGSSEEYIEKCLKKDRGSSSVALGFRISGLQIADRKGRFKRFARDEVKKVLTAADVRRVLREFVGDAESMAAVLYGENGVIAQLRDLKKWFEDQTLFHFYSASVLIAHERVADDTEGNVRVKLVDFAHVVDGEGVIDHNFLGGLSSLIRFLNDVAGELGKSGSCSQASSNSLGSGF